LYLGQAVIPTDNEVFAIKSSDVNTKYFYTKSAPRQISGKIIVTTNTGLSAEKSIVFTIPDNAAKSNSKTGGWIDRGGSKSSGTTYTEPQLVKNLRLEKTEKKQKDG